MGDTDRKLFVLDTNILLHEPFAIFSFQEHDVVIPMTVLVKKLNVFCACILRALGYNQRVFIL